MKNIGLLLMLYTMLTSNNVVNSQPTISYKKSNNVSSSDEIVNLPIPPPAPSPVSIELHQPPSPVYIPPHVYIPPLTPRRIPSPYPSPPPSPLPQQNTINNPSPTINPNMLTPTCQNMF